MREEIKNKFEGVSHKWIYFHTDSYEFQYILDNITAAISEKRANSKSSITLIKCFKFHEKAFVKFIKTTGRSKLSCVCQLIDADNNKIDIEFNPETVLNAALLNSTPKSLKLYRINSKNKNEWKKPDDGFEDSIYPPVEEELTELGYELYRDWQQEIKASGLSRDEYIKTIFGPNVRTIRGWHGYLLFLWRWILW